MRTTSRTFVLGILGIPSIQAEEDTALVSDFVALKALLGQSPWRQTWLCQFDPLQTEGVSSDRFFEVDSEAFKTKVLAEIGDMADTARSTDHFITVIFAHAETGEQQVQLADRLISGGRRVTEWLD